MFAWNLVLVLPGVFRVFPFSPEESFGKTEIVVFLLCWIALDESNRFCLELFSFGLSSMPSS
jgi:hypothetical protein